MSKWYDWEGSRRKGGPGARRRQVEENNNFIKETMATVLILILRPSKPSAINYMKYLTFQRGEVHRGKSTRRGGPHEQPNSSPASKNNKRGTALVDSRTKSSRKGGKQ